MTEPIYRDETFLNKLVKNILLKLVACLSFFSPNCGTWIKRLIFLLTVYTTLRTHRLYENLTITKLNDRLLKVRDKKVLDTMLGITRLNLANVSLDNNTTNKDVMELLKKSHLTIPEAEIVGKYIVEQTPTTLAYGESAMVQDVAKILTLS